jgi:hypothetical protein
MAQAPDTKAMQDKYRLLLEEAVTRIHALNIAYQNPAQHPPLIVRENCYLQLRFLCEIIALGCLVAHGDIQSKKLRDTYEANKIINAMARLKEYFYPQPMDVLLGQTGTVLKGRSDRVHLTKGDLIILWGKAGSVLHRGPLTKFIKEQAKDHSELSDIPQWGEKIGNLLNSHWITLVGNKQGMHAVLSEAATGKPSTTVFNLT